MPLTRFTLFQLALQHTTAILAYGGEAHYKQTGTNKVLITWMSHKTHLQKEGRAFVTLMMQCFSKLPYASLCNKNEPNEHTHTHTPKGCRRTCQMTTRNQCDWSFNLDPFRAEGGIPCSSPASRSSILEWILF